MKANKLLFIIIIMTIIGCQKIYAQTDSIYIVSHGKLLERGQLNGHLWFGLNNYPFDTLFIHLPKIYRNNQRSDSIKYVFKDIGKRPIKSGYASIDKNGFAVITGLHYKRLFIYKDDDGSVGRSYVVRLYFGNNPNYIILYTGK